MTFSMHFYHQISNFVHFHGTSAPKQIQIKLKKSQKELLGKSTIITIVPTWS